MLAGLDGQRVEFQGVGEVLATYKDAYNEGAGYDVDMVRVRVKLSEKPFHAVVINMPVVCVIPLEELEAVDKRDKAVGNG